MELLVVSFLAGALTVLAPCILPLLPVIIGSGALGEEKRPLKPFIITGSLAVSVFLFTLLLKASTSLLGIPPTTWQFISGIIIILLGLTLLWPTIWERFGAKLNIASSKLLGKAGRQSGILRDIATGAALGPVFSSCSPTYAFILAVVLPYSAGEGLLNLAIYTLGLAVVLLLIALLGQKLVSHLGWASNPHGLFKRTIAVLFIIVGLAVLFGFDKDLQAFIIDRGWYAPIESIELKLR